MKDNKKYQKGKHEKNNNSNTCMSRRENRKERQVRKKEK